MAVDGKSEEREPGAKSSGVCGACVWSKVRWCTLHAVDLVELCFAE